MRDGRGNPTKLTPEVARAILEAIEAGNYKATACAAAGVHRDTLNHWEHLADQGHEAYVEFVAALRQAEANAEMGLLAEIRGVRAPVVGVTGPEPWQAKAWIMERRYPKRWGLRVKAAVTEELEAFLARIEKRLDAPTFAKVIDASREDAADAAAEDVKH